MGCDYFKAINICIYALIIGIIGSVIAFSAIGAYLEDEIGLSWLFTLRGTVHAPKNVVSVCIDKSSADILHLPDDPDKWPRSYYAQLLAKINQQHPALIAFNVYFGEERDKDSDNVFAEQIGKQNNVILSNRLKQSTLYSVDTGYALSYEHIYDPIPLLANAALDIAPFPIPKTASTVKQFWTRKSSAGDLLTFPMRVMQHYVFKVAYTELLQVLQQTDLAEFIRPPSELSRLLAESKATDAFQHLQQHLSENPHFLEQLQDAVAKSHLSAEKQQLLQAWLALFNQSDSFYLNYYGQSGIIKTIPFYQALLIDSLDASIFTNKVVLIGYSETIEPERNQGFFTVYSKAAGLSVSNLELAATAVANLIEKSWLQPIEGFHRLFIVLAWSFVLLSTLFLRSYVAIVAAIAVLSMSYLAVAVFCFSNFYIWMPLFIPLAVQMPLALLLVTVAAFVQNQQDRFKLHKAFSFYLPDAIVNHLQNQSITEKMSDFGELRYGVCMATDAGQYTRLSETLTPQALHQLMNAYYAVVFAEVKRYGGIISDVVGDASLALWTNVLVDIESRVNACHAALAINASVETFTQAQEHELPTRIGLHYGEMRLGNVGAMDHFEYRAVGDCVNTATRIEALNKLLGTHILVSAAVIEGLPDFISREMGVFILKGKTMPIHVFELMAHQQQMTASLITLRTLFINALALFQAYEWDRALEAFKKINKAFPYDGPTQFYLRYLQQNIALFSMGQQHEQSAWIDSERAEERQFFTPLATDKKVSKVD